MEKIVNCRKALGKIMSFMKNKVKSPTLDELQSPNLDSR